MCDLGFNLCISVYNQPNDLVYFALTPPGLQICIMIFSDLKRSLFFNLSYYLPSYLPIIPHTYINIYLHTYIFACKFIFSVYFFVCPLMVCHCN